MTLRTLNYGNYGIFLIMGNAGFCPSTVGCLCFFVLVSVDFYGSDRALYGCYTTKKGFSGSNAV